MKKLVATKCTECDGDINVPDDAVSGEIVTCPDCGEDYEVKKIKDRAVILEKAETVAEDWGE